MKYTDEQIKFILKLYQEHFTCPEIAEKFNETFDSDKSPNAIEKTIRLYKNNLKYNHEEKDDEVISKNLKSSYSARKKVNRVNQENRALLEHFTTLEDFLVAWSEIIHNKDQLPVKINKPKKNKKATKMIVEPMLSDIHFGLKTDTYNAEVATKRIEQYTKTVIREIERKSTNYQIEKIHIPLLGDFMQSDSMHGKESAKACHLTNAEQMVYAIDTIFYKFILPIAKTGYPIEITGICGNHDRSDEKQHTVNPGKSYYTYTIYKMIELLVKETKLKNVKIEIPNSVYFVKDLFNSTFLYEHGHTVKGSTIKSLESELINRQGQSNKILSGIRIGHYHGDLASNHGRHIINASSVSDDHYGDLLGYKSRPGQIINFYVDSDRESSYYHSFTVDLGMIK